MRIKNIILGLVMSIFMLSAFTNKALAADYYWVGGSGNWTSFSGHWATTSGGSTYYGQVPTAADNVIIDANSGFTAGNRTITVNVAALCANFTMMPGITVAPIITNSASNNLSVYGNMTLFTGTTLSTPINFRPSASQTLTSNGVSLTGLVNVDGPGTLSLAATTTFLGLNFISGTFDTAGFALNVNYFESSSFSVKIVKFGASQINIANYAQFKGGNLTIQPGTSHLRFNKTNMNVGGNSFDGLSSDFNLSLYDVTFEATNPTSAGFNTGVGNFSFRNLTFKGNSIIKNGSHTVQNLSLATAKSLTLPSLSTFTITNDLTIGTTADACAGYSSLSAGTSGSQATIAMGALATANVYHTIISDIKITASAIVPAQVKSYDSGGNTGWSFPPPSSASTYYWVGGAGNWSDLSHWLVDDGSGSVAAICLPGFTDDVIFNNASGFTAAGQTVTVNVTAQCHNLSFIATSNAPRIVNNSITVTGSAIYQTGMILTTAIDYANQGSQTITSNGVVHAGSYVNLNGRDQNLDIITLVDNFTTTATLTQNGGAFNTNNKALTVASFISSVTASRKLELGSSVITVTASTFNTSGANITLVANTSTINFTGAAANMTCLNNVQTFFNVSFTNPSVQGNLSSGRFTTLTFAGNGFIAGSAGFTAATLNFASGKTYNFQGTLSAHNITAAFNAVGANCSSRIIMSSAGSYPLRFAAAATVNVNFASINGVRATRVSGSTPITALNSIDFGNNTGFVFPANAARDLHWVGGSGNWDSLTSWSLTQGGASGECPPGVEDNVFFDAGSGFTAGSKTVNLNGAASYAHNFTVAGAVVAPTFTGNGVNVYGSMILQTVTVYGINTSMIPSLNGTETLTTNGVNLNGSLTINASGNSYASTVKLIDNLTTTGTIRLSNGVFDTDGKNVRAASIEDGGSSSGNISIIYRTLKLGSSNVTLTTAAPQGFTLVTPGSTVQAGTSVIEFTSNSGIALISGLALNDVIFSNPVGTAQILNGFNNAGGLAPSYNNVTFHSVIFKGAATIFTTGNVFGTLLLSAGKTYQFKDGAEQTITDNLYAAGNSCKTLAIRSTTSGVQTRLKINGGSTSYNYILASDINATGSTINLDINSSNGGNNSNVVFSTVGTIGTILGLGADKLCYIIDTAVPASTILSASGFNGDIFTTYSWTKVSGTPAAPGVLGTGSTLDISTTGYGVYQVNVDYGDCPVSDQILVQEGSLPPVAAVNQIICGTVNTALSKVSIIGTAVKWYSSAGATATIPASTVITSGNTYYATQTVNNSCESIKIAIKVVIDNCGTSNPMLKSRASN